MTTESFNADDETNTRVTTVIREAAKLFESGLALNGKERAVQDALATGASLRLAIDFNMPTRITGYVMHGTELVELFAICVAFDLGRGAQGSH